MTIELTIVLIAVALLFALSIYQIIIIMAFKKHPYIGPITFILLIIGVLFALLVHYRGKELGANDWAQILLMIGLVTITAVYAWSSQRQANASAKMTEEMREQRVMASRPVIIQKAVVETETELRTFGSRDWFSHFQVYNAGNGPAIEVEISLLNREKTPIHSQRKTFLKASEPPIEFSPTELASLEKSTFYLVCEYQGIFSRGTQPTWYQTWLPFETVEASEKGKIYVKPGELEFREVHEKDRIDVFGARSKPK